MTVTWRRLQPLEIDHEALWLAVGAASLCLLGVALATPGIQLPRCALKTLTGLPCPTCGITRAVIALSRADFERAFFMNPLATAGCVVGLIYLLYAATVLALRLPRFRPTVSPAGARRVRLAAIAMLAINWAWLIATGR
jgi:hypothetical protein